MLQKEHIENCRNYYSSLLTCSDSHKTKDIPSTAYLREFMNTFTCDDVSNFSQIREEIKNELNFNDCNRLTRILNFEETSKDELIASQTCLRHYNTYNKQLLNSLTASDFLYYHTIEKAEKTLAVFGIIGATYGGLSAAIASYKMLKKLKK